MDDPARVRTRDLSEASGSDRRARGTEMNLVEHVEEFSAKLSLQPLPDRKVPHQCNIGIQQGRPVEEIAPCISIGAQLHLSQGNKGRRVEEFMDKRIAGRMTDADVSVSHPGRQLRMFQGRFPGAVQRNIGA